MSSLAQPSTGTPFVMLTPVVISRLLIREMSGTQLITLQEVDGPRMFPIAIGLPEAFAIERRLHGSESPRPQTHDLLDAAIQTLGGRLERIEIHDLSEGTFFARLVIDQDGSRVVLDARPSDAIALGVASNTPILVEDHVLDEASELPDDVEEGPADGDATDDDDDSGFA